VYGEGPASVPPATAGISIAGLPPVPAGASYDHLRAPFTAADIRFTTIGENLYATVLGWPTDGQVLIRSLASHLTLRLAPITEVTLLGYGPVAWRSALDGLHIDMPENQTGEYAWVFKIS
jgi:alpha-L-fucosidase